MGKTMKWFLSFHNMITLLTNERNILLKNWDKSQTKEKLYLLPFLTVDKNQKTKKSWSASKIFIKCSHPHQLTLYYLSIWSIHGKTITKSCSSAEKQLFVIVFQWRLQIGNRQCATNQNQTWYALKWLLKGHVIVLNSFYSRFRSYIFNIFKPYLLSNLIGMFQ